MTVGKPVPRFAAKRNARLSFVPEAAEASPGCTVRTWTHEFGNRLRARKIDVVIAALVGAHECEGRLTGSLSDLIVVFTVDYVLNPPSAVGELLDDVRSGALPDPPGLWLARYDQDDFVATAFGDIALWHVLSGSGNGGRFRHQEDPSDVATGGWKDDLSRAVDLVMNPTLVKTHAGCALCKLATLCRPQASRR
jgi:hypothetical protein